MTAKKFVWSEVWASYTTTHLEDATAALPPLPAIDGSAQQSPPYPSWQHTIWLSGFYSLISRPGREIARRVCYFSQYGAILHKDRTPLGFDDAPLMEFV